MKASRAKAVNSLLPCLWPDKKKKGGLNCSWPHPVHCVRVLGWIEKMLEVSGGKEGRTEEVRCRNRGDACCEFYLSWQGLTRNSLKQRVP